MAKINSNYQKLQAELPVPRDRQAGARLRRARTPSAADHPPGHRRRGAAAAAAHRRGPEGRRRRDGAQGDASRATAPSRATTSCSRPSPPTTRSQGAEVAADEIFVSDGSKCDTGNIQEIFAADNVVAVTDPVYPVYVDTNVMAGRTGAADAKGRYGRPGLPAHHRRERLRPAAARPQKVDLDLPLLAQQPHRRGDVARRRWSAGSPTPAQNEAIILFDAAYEAFIREPGQVHSIYEIPGAREVAIEFRSLSKTAGFTGTRCAYTVVPKELTRAQRQGRAGAAARAVEPPPHHQVQRRQLPHPEGGRRRSSRPRARRPSRPTSPTTWRTRASSARA